MDKHAAADHVLEAKERLGLTWKSIASSLGTAPAWTVSALLGNHPVPEGIARKTAALLELDHTVEAALRRQPYRVANPEIASDPTIYRFHEALDVYGAAIKELIHEEFGDGIMSAINFNLTIERHPHEGGTVSVSSSTANSSNTNGDSAREGIDGGSTAAVSAFRRAGKPRRVRKASKCGRPSHD